MEKSFQANGLPTLIGSLPMDDHEAAIRLVLKYSRHIPLWVQLPANKNEGMIEQFLPGMPGLTERKDRLFIDTSGELFENAVLAFYEDYMAANENSQGLLESRFALTMETAPGFNKFIEHVKTLPKPPYAVKGQITGPITFGLGLKDINDRSVFYDEQSRDIAIKLVALKAAWQARQLSVLERPVIIFLDEPVLAGFGSSEMISISHEEISICLEEVIEAVHSEGGLAGIHVCANTDWSIILNSSVDIVNFDAYSFFDRFILYGDLVKKFIESGRIIAWGIVPTGSPEHIDKETAGSLVDRWNNQAGEIEALGIDSETLFSQSLITPSCGTGSLDLEKATKVLKLTRDVSDKLRTDRGFYS
jgi:methionine synthase II (cobalamin-independent)